jgi:hypothetical protein
MPVNWILYRIVCILQMTSAAFILMSTLFTSFDNVSFSTIARLALFLLIILLAIFAVNTLNKNYPDTPITGPQKKTFNRLFLLNFVFLAFLFGFTIAEFRLMNQLAVITERSIFSLPFRVFITPLVYVLTLIFQFIILYGLYVLRRVLYTNFMKGKFEFESK